MPSKYAWTCGHEAEAGCGECYHALAAKAAALAADNLRMRDLLGRLKHAPPLSYGGGYVTDIENVLAQGVRYP